MGSGKGRRAARKLNFNAISGDGGGKGGGGIPNQSKFLEENWKAGRGGKEEVEY